MWLKTIILLLLLGVVVSLFSGLVFLFKDSERHDSKRALYALGVRISLAAALLLAVLYGFYTGQLRMGESAPWHDHRDQTGPVDAGPGVLPAAPSDSEGRP